MSVQRFEKTLHAGLTRPIRVIHISNAHIGHADGDSSTEEAAFAKKRTDE